MGLWRLLGGEVNLERVARMNDKSKIYVIYDAIINALDTSLNIDRSIDDEKNNIMWVLENFGRKSPNTFKYHFLKIADWCNHLHPKREDWNQKNWNNAWEWYDAYKKGGVFFQEYRIKIREKRLNEKEKDLSDYKSEIKTNRITRKLIKSYEKSIPKDREEINQLKRELIPLQEKEFHQNRLLDLQERAKHYGVPTRIIKEALTDKKFEKEIVDKIVNDIEIQIDQEKTNSISNSFDNTNNLKLENENLFLKKQILIMEMKLKGLEIPDYISDEIKLNNINIDKKQD